MKRFLLSLAFLLAMPSCEMCIAQAVGLDLAGTKSGRYFLLVDVAADGSVRVTQIQTVITIGGGGGGGNGDVPPTETLTTTIASRSVERVTDPNRAMNAKKLAMVYATIAANADSLKTVEAMQQATGQAAKAVLGNSLDAWKAWIAPVEVHLTQLAKDGHLQTTGQVAEQYRQIAKGLEMHTASLGPQELNPDNIRLILELIMMIIKMFAGGGL